TARLIKTPDTDHRRLRRRPTGRARGTAGRAPGRSPTVQKPMVSPTLRAIPEVGMSTPVALHRSVDGSTGLGHWDGFVEESGDELPRDSPSAGDVAHGHALCAADFEEESLHLVVGVFELVQGSGR